MTADDWNLEIHTIGPVQLWKNISVEEMFSVRAKEFCNYFINVIKINWNQKLKPFSSIVILWLPVAESFIKQLQLDLELIRLDNQK